MFSRSKLKASAWVLLLIPAVNVGCEALQQSSLYRMTPFATKSDYTAVEAEHRQKFVQERDPEALRWLLSHRVHNEMSVEEVSQVLGESGERRHDDRDYKTNGGYYQLTDVAYQWGPDRRGRTVILFFRDGKLVNFDPAEFR